MYLRFGSNGKGEKGAGRKKTKTPDGIESAKLAANARAEAIKQQLEKTQRFVQEAPRIAEERARQRRQEQFQRASRLSGGKNRRIGDALERVSELNVALAQDVAGSDRSRRRGGSGVWLFLFLLLALCAALIWSWFTWMDSRF
jgi:hypothetical protein